MIKGSVQVVDVALAAGCDAYSNAFEHNNRAQARARQQAGRRAARSST